LQATWTQAEPFVTSWQVVIRLVVCSIYKTASAGISSNGYPVAVSTVVTSPSYLSTRYLIPQRNNVYQCGYEVLEVAPIDDFGHTGTFSPPIAYRLA